MYERGRSEVKKRPRQKEEDSCKTVRKGKRKTGRPLFLRIVFLSPFPPFLLSSLIYSLALLPLIPHSNPLSSSFSFLLSSRDLPRFHGLLPFAVIQISFLLLLFLFSLRQLESARHVRHVSHTHTPGVSQVYVAVRHAASPSTLLLSPLLSSPTFTLSGVGRGGGLLQVL